MLWGVLRNGTICRPVAIHSTSFSLGQNEIVILTSFVVLPPKPICCTTLTLTMLLAKTGEVGGTTDVLLAAGTKLLSNCQQNIAIAGVAVCLVPSIAKGLC